MYLTFKDKLFFIFLLSISLSLALGTSFRNNAWQSELTIWHDVALKSDAKVRPHNNLGTAYRDDFKNPKEAIKHFNKAHELIPTEIPPLHNMAVAYLMLQDFENARFVLIKALNIDSSHTVLWGNLGYVNIMTGRIKEAKTAFVRALELDGNYKMARDNLNWIKMTYGEF